MQCGAVAPSHQYGESDVLVPAAMTRAFPRRDASRRISKGLGFQTQAAMVSTEL